MRRYLLSAVALAGFSGVAAQAQQAAPPAPKGSWELLTTAQPYPRQLWGVYPTAAACAAGQQQLNTVAMNRLASMHGVTPDEFTAAVNNTHALQAANCVQE